MLLAVKAEQLGVHAKWRDDLVGQECDVIVLESLKRDFVAVEGHSRVSTIHSHISNERDWRQLENSFARTHLEDLEGVHFEQAIQSPDSLAPSSDATRPESSPRPVACCGIERSSEDGCSTFDLGELGVIWGGSFDQPTSNFSLSSLRHFTGCSRVESVQAFGLSVGGASGEPYRQVEQRLNAPVVGRIVR